MLCGKRKKLEGLQGHPKTISSLQHLSKEATKSIKQERKLEVTPIIVKHAASEGLLPLSPVRSHFPLWLKLQNRSDRSLTMHVYLASRLRRALFREQGHAGITWQAESSYVYVNLERSSLLCAIAWGLEREGYPKILKLGNIQTMDA